MAELCAEVTPFSGTLLRGRLKNLLVGGSLANLHVRTTWNEVAKEVSAFVVKPLAVSKKGKSSPPQWAVPSATYLLLVHFESVVELARVVATEVALAP